MTTVADFKKGDKVRATDGTVIRTVLGIHGEFVDVEFEGTSGYFYPNELEKIVPKSVPTTIKQLRRVERLLRKLWIQGTWFRYTDKDGNKHTSRNFNEYYGKCDGMCLEGAIGCVAAGGKTYGPAYKNLADIVREQIHPSALNEFNDHHNKETVLKVVRNTINSERRKYHV